MEHSLTYIAVDGHFHVQAANRASANALIDALRQKGVEIESVSAKSARWRRYFWRR